jgi:hypothetical protein
LGVDNNVGVDSIAGLGKSGDVVVGYTKSRLEKLSILVKPATILNFHRGSSQKEVQRIVWVQRQEKAGTKGI